MMAKSGQKHGHYSALRHSSGVGNCLKIFFWPLDVMQQLSQEILLRGAAREGKGPQNRKQWDEAGSSSFSGVVERSDGREAGSRLEDRSADAPLRQQTSGSSPLRFAKFTQNRVHRVTFTDPFGRFVAKHPANKRFIVTNSEQRELG